MQAANRHTVELRLINIAETLLQEYYGGARDEKRDKYAAEFDKIYRALHQTITEARKENYKYLGELHEKPEGDTEDG